MPLDRLSPIEVTPQDQLRPQLGQTTHSPKQLHSHFRLNDRVVVFDKSGTDIHGSVKLIDEVAYGGDKLLAIGIETVITLLRHALINSY